MAASDLSDEALIDELYHRILGRPASAAEVDSVAVVFADIQDDHRRLVSRKTQSVDELRAEFASREVERQQTVVRLERAIARRRAQLLPAAQKAASEHEMQIAALEKEIAERQSELLESFDAWEASLADDRDQWTRLAPEELATTFDGKLFRDSQGTVRAAVKKGKGEYRVAGPVTGERVTAVRVEALSDPRLPHDGPGTQPDSGNFVLTELQVALIPATEDAEPIEAELINPRALHSQGGYPVEAAADGKVDDGSTGWAVSPQEGKDHVAVFDLKEPLVATEGSRLEFRLQQHYRDDAHQIGRFRLSYATSEEPVGFGLPPQVADILHTPAAARSTPQIKVLIDHQRDQDERLSELRKRLAVAREPSPPDEELARLEKRLAEAQQPPRLNPTLRRLTLDADLSEEQLEELRLTAVQDLAWALINSPAFLYNH